MANTTTHKRLYRLMIVALLVALMATFGLVVGAQDDATDTPAQAPFLGITFEASDDGVRVTAIVPDSPAESVGLAVGDVITAIDDEPVTADNIAERIAGFAVGDEIALTVTRGDETLSLAVTLGAFPDDVIISGAQLDTMPFSYAMGRPFLGVTLENSDDGVRVIEVAPDSPAESIGLQVGDLIREVNGQAVTTAREVVNAIATQRPASQVSLVVERDGETLTFDVVLRALTEDRLRPRLRPLDPQGLRGNLDLMGAGIAMTYLPDEGAWLIQALSEDTPYYADGLRAGDRILLVDGEPLAPQAHTAPLRLLMNDTVTLTVERDGETLEIETTGRILIPLFTGATLRLGALENLDELFNMEIVPPVQIIPRMGRGFVPGMPLQPAGARLGVAFIMLDEQVAAEYEVELTEGALITQVAPRSPADRAGLQVGDVVVAVDDQALTTALNLRDVVAGYAAGDNVTLTVSRGGETLMIEVTLGQPEQFSSAPRPLIVPGRETSRL